MEIVATIILSASFGFLFGIIWSGICESNHQYDLEMAESRAEALLNENNILHSELEECNETIATLSDEKANLQDTITILSSREAV